MTEARIAPTSSSPALTSGVPWMLPASRMPPEMVNSANSRMMNDMYSVSSVCSTASVAEGTPKASASGTTTSAAQSAVILP